jgi:protocatechuate 3,4-dioxygenase beta subunit
MTPLTRGGNNNYAPLILAENQEVKDIDFLLPRAGVISGTVLDEHNEPIPDVQVFAMMKTYFQARMQLQNRASATTDDRGHYRIHDLPTGRYYVQAAKHLLSASKAVLPARPFDSPGRPASWWIRNRDSRWEGSS